jgi:hypothetical protein
MPVMITCAESRLSSKDAAMREANSFAASSFSSGAEFPASVSGDTAASGVLRVQPKTSITGSINERYNAFVPFVNNNNFEAYIAKITLSAGIVKVKQKHGHDKRMIGNYKLWS